MYADTLTIREQRVLFYYIVELDWPVNSREGVSRDQRKEREKGSKIQTKKNKYSSLLWSGGHSMTSVGELWRQG